MDNPVLYTKGLLKKYKSGDSEIEVLRGIDMQLFPGEFVALVGQSGSGKSTLLNIIGALDRPTAGELLVNGVDTATADDETLAELRNKDIGFIFQFHYLLDEFTCLENALLPLFLQHGANIAETERQRIVELLKEVGLGHRLNSKPSKMSGGEQQRTAVIRSLANRPKLVLADEPTGNLDSDSGQQVFELMRTMNRELGTAFLLVTHDNRLAQQADRTLRIVDGKLKEE